MKYAKEVYEKTKKTLKDRRETAELEAVQRHNAFASEHPELLWIEQEMSKTGLAAVQEVLNGKGAEAAINDLAKYNLSLQADREKLLKACNLPADYLKPKYTCEICKDTGYDADGKMCDCQLDLLHKYSCEMLSNSAPLSASTFENFSLQYYPKEKDMNGVSPYNYMQGVLDYCVAYANDFQRDSQSLFFCGETGLGKTHLSLSIANKVLEKGFNVVYDTAQNLLSKLEREHFRNGYSSSNVEDSVLQCDLLILDDLGTEFDTRFTVAEIYNIINTRILSNKPTIISSNFRLEELEKRYTNRVVSRIIGNYELLYFKGNDIRQLKKHI